MFDFISKKFSKSKEKSELEEQGMAERLKDGTFTLDDFAKQMAMMDKFEKIQKMAKFIPGMSKKLGQVSPEMLERGKKELEVFKRIIALMTLDERSNPNILTAVRKQQIASDSGVVVQIINEMLQKFEQTKQFVKMFKSTGKMPKF